MVHPNKKFQMCLLRKLGRHLVLDLHQKPSDRKAAPEQSKTDTLKQDILGAQAAPALLSFNDQVKTDISKHTYNTGLQSIPASSLSNRRSEAPAADLKALTEKVKTETETSKQTTIDVHTKQTAAHVHAPHYVSSSSLRFEDQKIDVQAHAEKGQCDTHEVTKDHQYFRWDGYVSNLYSDLCSDPQISRFFTGTKGHMVKKNQSCFFKRVWENEEPPFQNQSTKSG